MHISARCIDSHEALCQGVFQIFAKKYIDCEIDYSTSEDTEKPFVNLYLYPEPKQRDAEKRPSDIYIAIQYCERGVDPAPNTDQESSNVFSILYSESESRCYGCSMNNNARSKIKKWIKETVKPYIERERHCNKETKNKETIRSKMLSKANTLQVIDVTKNFCRDPFLSFVNEFLSDINPEWKEDHHALDASKPLALLCSQTSRPGCDIDAILKCGEIPDFNHIILILINFCESGVPLDIPITRGIDERITAVVNIVYSDSQKKCYKCAENEKAKYELKNLMSVNV